MGQEISGTLRLGVSNYITLHKLPGLLKIFRERFPKVDFHVTTGWSKEVLNLIYKGRSACRDCSGGLSIVGIEASSF